MSEHHLKTWPEYFKAIKDKSKPFEVRRTDRDYRVGDLLYLEEFEPCEMCSGTGQCIDLGEEAEECISCLGDGGSYTGEQLARLVSYCLYGGKFGIMPDYVVMGLREEAE